MLGELLLAHFVGDFVLQNDAMAQRKKTSHYWCSVHVLTYLMPFLLTGPGFLASVTDWGTALVTRPLRLCPVVHETDWVGGVHQTSFRSLVYLCG